MQHYVINQHYQQAQKTIWLDNQMIHMPNCWKEFSLIPYRLQLLTASYNWLLEYSQIIHLELFISVYTAAAIVKVKEARE
jgi:hypothetical protein